MSAKNTDHSDREKALPEGWTWATLGDVCESPQYGWTTKASDTGTLHLLRTSDITSGKIEWDTVPFCSENPPYNEKYLVKDGDIVISRAGSVGFSHLIKDPQPAVFASYLIRFKPLINEKYIAYFLKSPSYWESISEQKLGIAIPNVNATKLKQISIPIAPSQEQERIVDKIEELLSQLDSGVGELNRVQANLARYKASVLKAACEGRLVPTEAELARAEGRDYESGEELLLHILAERKKKWGEEQRAKGKDPSKMKYQEPEPPDTEGLPELPEGWVWGNLCQLTDMTSGRAFKKREYTEEGIRLLQIANVSFGKVIWEQNAYLPSNYERIYSSLVLKSGDILMALNRPILNERLKIGKLHKLDTPAILYQRVGRFDFFIKDIDLYFFYFAQSPFFIDKLKVSLQGVDQPFVNKPKLLSIPIPIPPLKEQHRIVSEVERLLSVIRELERIIEVSIKRANRLRQATLKQAFEGKLVPQDPEDEPANKLLEQKPRE
jgi:type I restriction enzyme S subunit